MALSFQIVTIDLTRFTNYNPTTTFLQAFTSFEDLLLQKNLRCHEKNPSIFGRIILQ
jgi:hypothetical protein